MMKNRLQLYKILANPSAEAMTSARVYRTYDDLPNDTDELLRLLDYAKSNALSNFKLSLPNTFDTNTIESIHKTLDSLHWLGDMAKTSLGQLDDYYSVINGFEFGKNLGPWSEVALDAIGNLILSDGSFASINEKARFQFALHIQQALLALTKIYDIYVSEFQNENRLDGFDASQQEAIKDILNEINPSKIIDDVKNSNIQHITGFVSRQSVLRSFKVGAQNSITHKILNFYNDASNYFLYVFGDLVLERLNEFANNTPSHNRGNIDKKITKFEQLIAAAESDAKNRSGNLFPTLSSSSASTSASSSSSSMAAGVGGSNLNGNGQGKQPPLIHDHELQILRKLKGLSEKLLTPTFNATDMKDLESLCALALWGSSNVKNDYSEKTLFPLDLVRATDPNQADLEELSKSVLTQSGSLKKRNEWRIIDAVLSGLKDGTGINLGQFFYMKRREDLEIDKPFSEEKSADGLVAVSDNNCIFQSEASKYVNINYAHVKDKTQLILNAQVALYDIMQDEGLCNSTEFFASGQGGLGIRINPTKSKNIQRTYQVYYGELERNITRRDGDRDVTEKVKVKRFWNVSSRAADPITPEDLKQLKSQYVWGTRSVDGQSVKAFWELDKLTDEQKAALKVDEDFPVTNTSKHIPSLLELRNIVQKRLLQNLFRGQAIAVSKAYTRFATLYSDQNADLKEKELSNLDDIRTMKHNLKENSGIRVGFYQKIQSIHDILHTVWDAIDNRPSQTKNMQDLSSRLEKIDSKLKELDRSNEQITSPKGNTRQQSIADLIYMVNRAYQVIHGDEAEPLVENFGMDDPSPSSSSIGTSTIGLNATEIFKNLLQNPAYVKNLAIPQATESVSTPKHSETCKYHPMRPITRREKQEIKSAEIILMTHATQLEDLIKDQIFDGYDKAADSIRQVFEKVVVENRESQKDENFVLERLKQMLELIQGNNPQPGLIDNLIARPFTRSAQGFRKNVLGKLESLREDIAEAYLRLTTDPYTRELAILNKNSSAELSALDEKYNANSSSSSSSRVSNNNVENILERNKVWLTFLEKEKSIQIEHRARIQEAAKYLQEKGCSPFIDSTQITNDIANLKEKILELQNQSKDADVASNILKGVESINSKYDADMQNDPKTARHAELIVAAEGAKQSIKALYKDKPYDNPFEDHIGELESIIHRCKKTEANQQVFNLKFLVDHCISLCDSFEEKWIRNQAKTIQEYKKIHEQGFKPHGGLLSDRFKGDRNTLAGAWGMARQAIGSDKLYLFANISTKIEKLQQFTQTENLGNYDTYLPRDVDKNTHPVEFAYVTIRQQELLTIDMAVRNSQANRYLAATNMSSSNSAPSGSRSSQPTGKKVFTRLR